MKILALDSDPRSTHLLEEHCRAILAQRLERFDHAASLATAHSRLTAAAFDLLLLNPQLDPENSLNHAAPRSTRRVPAVVVSADPTAAVQAFEHGALDFVPKPVTRERLARALLRVAPPATPAPPPGQKLAVRRHGRIDLVDVDDLLYVEGSDKYSELVLADGQRRFYDKCLSRVEAVLPGSFARIHKSYVVRFPLVSRLLVFKGSRYFAELRNGLRLPVGRSRYAQVKARLL